MIDNENDAAVYFSLRFNEYPLPKILHELARKCASGFTHYGTEIF
jgi:hypothetical protein